MLKLTAQDVFEINELMLAITAKYINAYNKEDMHELVIGDVQHNINALAQFNKTHDVEQLYDAVMGQDTLVREYYIRLLNYIDELISEYNTEYFALI